MRPGLEAWASPQKSLINDPHQYNAGRETQAYTISERKRLTRIISFQIIKSETIPAALLDWCIDIFYNFLFALCACVFVANFHCSVQRELTVKEAHT
jgi:hypothetical protein